MNKLSVLVFLLVVGMIIVSNANAQETVTNGVLNAAYKSWGKPSLKGDWSIVQDGDQLFVQLSDNFKAKKGPDVKIFLSPTPASDITAKNALDGSVLVKLLDDFEGEARIPIPGGTDLSKFQSLVFHCEAYSKLWGSSALR